MLKHSIDTLRFNALVRQHNRKHKNRVLNVMPTKAELNAIEAFRNLGAQTDFPTRLGQAAMLEAHKVPEKLVAILCDIAGRGQLNLDHIYRLGDEGISINYGTPVIEKNVRLAKAVTRLAFIAGPGFTTDHLIDEGIVQEGDL